MNPNRVIKLPVFRAMVCPVAKREWTCAICKEPIEEGARYAHYFNRQVHVIKDYRFHMECFGIVEAYCIEKNTTEFTPLKVRNWANKTFCEECKEECPLHRCKRVDSAIKAALRVAKKSRNAT